MDSLEQVIEDLSFFRDLMIDKDYKIRLRFEEYRFKLKQYYGLKLAFGLSFIANVILGTHFAFRDENITEPYMFRNFTDTTF
jgi:hypothetical protein